MALWSSAVKISWKKSCSIVRQYMIHLNTINLHVINTPTTWQQLLTRKPYLKLKWRVFSMGFMKTCWQYDSHLDWEALSLKTGVNKKKSTVHQLQYDICKFMYIYHSNVTWRFWTNPLMKIWSYSKYWLNLSKVTKMHTYLEVLAK